VATLAYPIIVLFATVRFVDAVIPLAVMCVASLPVTLGAAINPTLLTLERTKTASLITLFSILLEALLAYISLAYIQTGLVGVAFSRLFAVLAAFIIGAYILRSMLNVEFDREAVWKSAVASAIMVLSILVMEFLRTMVEPSYQFLVLRLRQLPVYAVVGVTVYLLSLAVLRAVKKRDIELLRDFLPARLRWVADLVSRILKIGL
jgi:O-antigen/teichoic acid export membrane protein